MDNAKWQIRLTSSEEEGKTTHWLWTLFHYGTPVASGTAHNMRIAYSYAHSARVEEMMKKGETEQHVD